MNYLKLFFLLFLISIPLDIVSSPWIPSDNIKYNLIKFNLTKLCSYNLQENHISQIPIINIINQINNIDSDNIECNSYIDEVIFNNSNISIISNYNGAINNNINEIIHCLKNQMSNRVRWTESIKNLENAGENKLIEIGPGKILSGLIKRISKSFDIISIENISDLKSLE